MRNFIFCAVYLESIMDKIKLLAKWRNWYKAFSDTFPTGKVYWEILDWKLCPRKKLNDEKNSQVKRCDDHE